VKQGAARALLRALRLPRLDSPPPRLAELLARDEPVLFHGSSRPDLEVLEPIRLSRDATEFGDQQAVFGAADPVWAVFFAVLRRDELQSMRNGSFAPAGGPLFPRWYFFSRDDGASVEDWFGDGWLYVLPRETFRPQRPVLGIDSGQWASPVAVRPILRVPVTVEDFPLAGQVVPHALDEPIWKTILRVRRQARSQRATNAG
jgi:hypothetical protein